MLRWIVLVLALALPMRGVLAAVQFCPWMDGAAAASVMAEMSPDDCAGMSQADGHCTLQAACAATPVLPALIASMPHEAAPAPQGRSPPGACPTALAVPERVPIHPN